MDYLRGRVRPAAFRHLAIAQGERADLGQLDAVGGVARSDDGCGGERERREQRRGLHGVDCSWSSEEDKDNEEEEKEEEATVAVAGFVCLCRVLSTWSIAVPHLAT